MSVRTGGYPFGWSLGGGTALMIQIGHRQSHDIDIFIDDAQVLGFLDPAKVDLHFQERPDGYRGDGARFQKFTFTGIGEIDFIVAGSLTNEPFVEHTIEQRPVKLETVAEIVAKKVYHRGRQAQPRDVFDIAAAAHAHRDQVIAELRRFPEQVAATNSRLDTLNPEYVRQVTGQLMILPAYQPLALSSLETARALLEDALTA